MVTIEEKSLKDVQTQKGSKTLHNKIPPFDNPCLKEQEMSLKCLDENNYNRDGCSREFANYKACKDFWGKVYSERRAKGIVPYLPPPEERVIIKEEYMKKKI